MQQTVTSAPDRDWAKIAYWLVLGTLFYNVAEAVVALWSGFAASSNALVGFGFDSIIESAAAGVLLWRVSVETGGGSAEEIEAAETRVHRFVGITFFLLAAYVTVDAIITLINQQAPAESPVGIVLAILSLIIMPILAFFKFRAADHLDSGALRSEAKETLACMYLSFALLLGLSLNAVFDNLWWADPAAALLMVPWLIKEGMEGFEDEHD
ncbi:MAG: cation transporter [Candidatus Marinimicrobia bacterium]|nr:cation transporter [Candidatus Neomarinimicrobiota bacterium]MCF7827920.1 cation transporter [Candidatus Neomarinimicrobiota bacterium]MCF7879325.1 cation transporter [Candidatus Neomarinimicrobiota bacterium]